MNPGLETAIEIAGGCFSQNATILYPDALYTGGNMGRNILRGPRFVNWDASVAKTWNIHEKYKLQLRGEVFNFPNHTNFAASSVGGDLTSQDSFGRADTTPDVQTSNR